MQPPARRATIRDVARHAGVGKVTVSYVLNGQSRTARISEETEQRVLKAAADLNYRPNAVARMLVTKQTNAVAVVFQRGSFFTSWSGFTMELMRGVSTAAVELGLDLVLHTREVTEENEARMLAGGQVDGALVLRDTDDPMVEELTELGLPCVRFFSRASNGSPYVDADNYMGGRMATRHLLELGHRRILMVRGSFGSSSSNDRYNGYRDAMESAGLPECPSVVIASGGEAVALRTLMLDPKTRPTALFVWSDEVAFACMGALRDLGLRIPEDVSIVGFDSLGECERSVPPLTSVRQPIFEMAVEATRLLGAIIRGEQPARTQILFPLVVDVRGSSAPCPEAHKEVSE